MKNSLSLTKKDVIASVIIGFVFWLAGVMIANVASRLGAQNNMMGFIFYVLLGIPSGFLTIWTCQYIARIPFNKILESLAIGLMVATFFDGTFLNWLPHFYSTTGLNGAAFGGAFVLWGVFCLYSSYFILLFLQRK